MITLDTTLVVVIGGFGLAAQHDSAGTVAFLASIHAGYITCQTINFDGGNVLS